jgi:basic membrane protein A
MKKLVSLILALVLSLGLCAAALAETYEIGMITDIGTIDDKSFNQGTWEAIKAYAEANGKTYNYYQPSAQSTEIYVERIDQAVADGAKIIVTPGYLFEKSRSSSRRTSIRTPTSSCIDGNRTTRLHRVPLRKNARWAIVFAEEQAGASWPATRGMGRLHQMGCMGGLGGSAVVVAFRLGLRQGRATTAPR